MFENSMQHLFGVLLTCKENAFLVMCSSGDL